MALAPNRSETKFESLQRTVSDMSFEIAKEGIDGTMAAITEVEEAVCECCRMTEECTAEYIGRVRENFMGKLICGLCAEAVKEEMEKKGAAGDEALNRHMSACARFNRLERAYPVLYQAHAIREILKKRTTEDGGRRNGRIVRSSSCIPAIARGVADRTMVN